MTTGIELLAIPAIGALLQVLLAKLATREVWNFFKEQRLDHKQLTELKFLLVTVSAVMTDAEEKEISSPSLKVWVEQLKDIVYEAEDVLDEIITRTNQTPSSNGDLKKKVRGIIFTRSTDQKPASNGDLKEKVEDIVFQLRSVVGQKDVLGFKGLGGKTSSPMPSSSLVSEPQVLGRENDERLLLEFLLPNGGNDRVLAANENGDPVIYENEQVAAGENERPENENGAPVMNANEQIAAGENRRPANENENGAPPAMNANEQIAAGENGRPANENENRDPAMNANEQIAADENERPANENGAPAVNANEQIAAGENGRPANENENENRDPAMNANEQIVAGENERPANVNENENENGAPSMNTNEQIAAGENRRPANDNENENGAPAMNTNEQIAAGESERPANENENGAHAMKANEQIAVGENERPPNENENENGASAMNANEQIVVDENERPANENENENGDAVTKENEQVPHERRALATGESGRPANGDENENGAPAMNANEQVAPAGENRRAANEDENENGAPAMNVNEQVAPAEENGRAANENENENGAPAMNENEQVAHEIAAGENGRPANDDGVPVNEILPDENQLVMNRVEIPVLAIVGMPGVGKTTLAQLLFNCPRVKANFNQQIWIHVSQEFDVLKVTQLIYQHVISGDRRTLELNGQHVRLQAAQPADLNMLQVKIHEAIQGKTLLLVLDDIWSENFVDLDVLKRPFKDVAPGSRIILTSRSISVASTMRASRTHHLKCLPDDDCWSLFVRHAFNRGIDSGVQPEIKERIVKKCSGLPLAAKALGALLYSKGEVDEWISVLNSEIWELPSDKCSILPVLRLSYDHLPSHLKRCFAYCSIFPKGFKIDKELVIRLWMAEGLVMQHKNKRREEVGDECFRELVSRSFFQQLGSHDKPYFTMHDLFNDLARDVAGEFCFNFEEGSPYKIGKKVRHFSFSARRNEVLAQFASFNGDNHLRTFLPLKSISSIGLQFPGDYDLVSFFRSFSHLRVLSLSPYQIPKIDKSIGNLKYLRYLDLSHTLIQALPDTICSLCNLEALLLLECIHLTELPKGMKELTNLQHLNIKETNRLNKMPPEFGTLKNLHVLTDFVVGDGGSSNISELKQLSHLGGALSIRKLENANSVHAADANLKEKKYLSELVFRWTEGIVHNVRNEANVLAALQPHKNLKKITIINYGGEMSQTLQLPCLQELHVKNCPQLTNSLPKQLPSLNTLHISECPNLALQFLNQDTAEHWYKALKSLEVRSSCNSMASFPLDYFTELENLQIQGCIHLESFTHSLPRRLSNLQSLSIKNCNDQLKPEIGWGLHQMDKLTSFEIEGPYIGMESFPEDSLLPVKLQFLHISGFNDLSSLNSLQRLTYLDTLVVDNCHNLNCISSEQLPVDMKYLNIERCPLMTQRCRQGGEDWLKIGHISKITINGEEIK